MQATSGNDLPGLGGYPFEARDSEGARVEAVGRPGEGRLRCLRRPPVMSINPTKLRAAGVERVLALTVGVVHGRPLLDDGQVLDVVNVIWCIGFEHAAGWIEMPIPREECWPLEERGVVPHTIWQRTGSSGKTSGR
jgi:hypothetical protein